MSRKSLLDQAIKNDSGGEPLEPQIERRHITALCYDLVGSTSLLARSDLEDFQELMTAFQGAARQAIAVRGGNVRDELGDGGIALFPMDSEPKDAASAAIQSGLDLVRVCKQIGNRYRRDDLHVRVGIATSVALVQQTSVPAIPSNVTGMALVLATRLQAMADPDTVFVSQETRDLARRSHNFRNKGTKPVKGFPQAQQIWRALSHKLDVDRFHAFGRLNIPLIGRTKETQIVKDCWERVTRGRGEVILVEGEAGIGKSRLLRHTRSITRGGRSGMLLYQCSPATSKLTLHPLLNALLGTSSNDSSSLSSSHIRSSFEQHGVFDEEVIKFFSFLLGALELREHALRDASPEILRAKSKKTVQRALEQLSARGPYIIAIEDVHWIDPTSQRILIEIAASVHLYPVLLIITTRPVVNEAEPSLPPGTHIVLDRLNSEESSEAITALWPRSRVSELPRFLDVISHIANGVPLLIEEACQWMSENVGASEQALSKTVAPSWTAAFEYILNARLKKHGQANEVAKAAAVVGSPFNFTLLRELLPNLSIQATREAISGLLEGGFITRVRSSRRLLYSFRHALVQETLYSSMLLRRRKLLHQRAYLATSGARDLAPWWGPAVIAQHAELAGLAEDAIRWFVEAGTESSARSALGEARFYLEHAMKMCEQLTDSDSQQRSLLSAMASLGPVLTGSEGSKSTAARRLYDDGVRLARQRPNSEQNKWFSIYWGWWFTGGDFSTELERAHSILSDLKNVDDPEVQLQARHCVWAIEFNLGHHETCIAAIDEGLALYGAGRGRENTTLYGGHDAKVCGLGQKSLSLWLTGHPRAALQAVSEARQWALQTEHVGTIAHGYDIEAMLHRYRRDFDALNRVLGEMRQLAQKHGLPALAAKVEIFEGWSLGHTLNPLLGRTKIERGLAVHEEIESSEDLPVYRSMLAEVMSLTGNIDPALQLLSAAAKEADNVGHRYWLADLYNKYGRLLLRKRADRPEILRALEDSLRIAAEQKAAPFLLSAWDTLSLCDPPLELIERYSREVEDARRKIVVEGEFFAQSDAFSNNPLSAAH